MPTDATDVDAIARAAAEFENAASDLHKERATLARAEEDLAERAEAVERQRQEHVEAEAALDEAERFQAALDEEFRTLEEALQTDVQHVLEQIRQAERTSRRPSSRTRSTTGAPGASTTRLPRPTGTCSTNVSRSPTRWGSSSIRPPRSVSSPAPTCGRC